MKTTLKSLAVAVVGYIILRNLENRVAIVAKLTGKV